MGGISSKRGRRKRDRRRAGDRARGRTTPSAQTNRVRSGALPTGTSFDAGQVERASASVARIPAELREPFFRMLMQRAGMRRQSIRDVRAEAVALAKRGDYFSCKHPEWRQQEQALLDSLKDAIIRASLPRMAATRWDAFHRLNSASPDGRAAAVVGAIQVFGGEALSEPVQHRRIPEFGRLLRQRVGPWVEAATLLARSGNVAERRVGEYFIRRVAAALRGDRRRQRLDSVSRLRAHALYDVTYSYRVAKGVRLLRATRIWEGNPDKKMKFVETACRLPRGFLSEQWNSTGRGRWRNSHAWRQRRATVPAAVRDLVGRKLGISDRGLVNILAETPFVE